MVPNTASRPIIILTHCILVNSSTIRCWMSICAILGVSGLFCPFYSIFDGKGGGGGWCDGAR